MSWTVSEGSFNLFLYAAASVTYEIIGADFYININHCANILSPIKCLKKHSGPFVRRLKQCRMDTWYIRLPYTFSKYNDKGVMLLLRVKGRLIKTQASRFKSSIRIKLVL